MTDITISDSGGNDISRRALSKARDMVQWKIRALETFVAPLTDLGLRVAVGLVFFKSGKSKLLPNCENGLICIDPSKANLFEWEYIPNWKANAPFAPPFDAATMASLTTWAELILPALLILGLGGRLAAFSLLIMSLVIEFWIYPGQFHEHWYWIAILAALVARGPGVLSGDHVLKHFLLKKSKKG